MRHLFSVENIDRWGSNWLTGTKMCNFHPKIWIFWAKSQFLFWYRDFCQQGISPVYPGLQLTHWNHPRKKVSEIWIIFRGSPSFWPFAESLLWVPLILVVNETWWDCRGHQKKWATMTTDLVPAEITEKRSFLRFFKRFFFAKIPLLSKNIARIANVVQVTIWLKITTPQCHDSSFTIFQ